jgi:hypothetical protein
MNPENTLVPDQSHLRALARAQAEPLHDDIKRMEILYALMESVLDIDRALPRDHEMLSDIRDGVVSHAMGKSAAYENTITLKRLKHFYDGLETHLAKQDVGAFDLQTPLLKSIVRAAQDFYGSTADGDDFKKAWAKKGALPQQSPFTAFTITNEIMIRVMPKIEADYPEVTLRAWAEPWNGNTAKKLRVTSAQNYEMGAVDADDLEHVCAKLNDMTQYIAGVQSAFSRPEQIRAERDMNCRVLNALSHYISPYMKRLECPVPDTAAPDNMFSLADARRARMAPRPL